MASQSILQSIIWFLQKSRNIGILKTLFADKVKREMNGNNKKEEILKHQFFGFLTNVELLLVPVAEAVAVLLTDV